MKPNLANVKATEETLKVSRSIAGIDVDQGAFSALSHATSLMLRLRILPPSRLSTRFLQHAG